MLSAHRPGGPSARGLAALVPLLALMPLMAGAIPLDIQAPAPKWHTVVTGRGEEASVAWPDGSAAMTPRWVTAQVEVVWNCASGAARHLEVKTARGPSSQPSRLDARALSGEHEGTRRVELYLWEVSQVKAACAQAGDVAVESVPVLLSLRCEGAEEVRESRRLPLQVQCEPASPSREALTGLPGTERARRFQGREVPLPKFSLLWPDASPGKPPLRKPSLLEFTPVVIAQWAPEMTALRVVRLDARGGSAESSPPAARSKQEQEDVFVPRMRFTPTTPGTARFVLEAEYKDGSRLRSQPEELWVEDPAAKGNSSGRHSLEGFAQEYPGWDLCSRKGVWWLRRQPWVESVSSTGHDLSYQAKGGGISLVSCHEGH